MGIKHTPGPWEVTQIDCLGNEIVEYGNVRPVNRHMFGHETSLPIADFYLWDMPEQRANAHLIAAAPDLLEALTDAVIDFDNWAAHEDNHPHEHLVAWAEKARAAIAKAKGESK